MSIWERDYMRRDNQSPPRLNWSYVILAFIGILIVVSAVGRCSKAAKDTSILSKGSLVVNVNEATLDELQTLPGVGPARAKLVIQHRPYRTVDDLSQKHALPKSVVEQDRPLLKISGKNERVRKG